MSYTNVHVNISDFHKRNLKHALEHGEPVSIRLGYNDLCGDDILALTNAQINRITKAYENGRGIMMKMSRRQVEHNKTIDGGFLSLLAGLAAKALPFLAKTVLPTLVTGALSGVELALVQKATNKAMGNGLYLKKGSNIARVETDGQGLYLKSYKGSGLRKVGDGLYLKQGDKLLAAMSFFLVQYLR